MTGKELERCIEEYGRDIYSFCKYLTCDTQEADDLYQDTFLKAMELKEKINYQKNAKSYLISIAIRIWKNRKRKYAWRKRIAESGRLEMQKETETAQGREDSPEEQVLQKEKLVLVRQSVERLPEKFKVIILLYYMEELSVPQIAETVKIPAGTVKSRLFQARRLLEKELEDVLDEKRNR